MVTASGSSCADSRGLEVGVDGSAVVGARGRVIQNAIAPRTSRMQATTNRRLVPPLDPFREPAMALILPREVGAVRRERLQSQT